MAKEENVPSFLSQHAGQGFEDMGATAMAVPLLLICQSNSANAVEAGVKPGHFYNSITKADYGDTLRVVPCFYKTAWFEWLPDGGGLAGRYDVGGCPVTGDPYSGMTNKNTGNSVVETWIYYVVLPDLPDEGYLTLTTTRGSMKYFKAWNTLLKFNRLPDGTEAPIFSNIWTLGTGKDQNKAGQKYFSPNVNGKAGFTKGEIISKELYESLVEPLADIAPSLSIRIDASAQAALTETTSEEDDKDY